MTRKTYADLHGLPEDGRISVIVAAVARSRLTVAVMVDAEPGKAERYAAKIRAALPGCTVSAALPGPVAGVVTLRVGPPPPAPPNPN